jgi:hypothetical protein
MATTMNPLHFETMARDRMAERDRTIASWALARSIHDESVREPAPEPWPQPPFPRLAVGRLVDRLRQAVTHSAA